MLECWCGFVSLLLLGLFVSFGVVVLVVVIIGVFLLFLLKECINVVDVMSYM